MLSFLNIWKSQNNTVQIVFGIIFHELFNEPQTYGRDTAVDQSQMCNAKEPKKYSTSVLRHFIAH